MVKSDQVKMVVVTGQSGNLVQNHASPLSLQGCARPRKNKLRHTQLQFPLKSYLPGLSTHPNDFHILPSLQTLSSSHRLEVRPTKGPRAENICRRSEARQSCNPRKTRLANNHQLSLCTSASKNRFVSPLSSIELSLR